MKSSKISSEIFSEFRHLNRILFWNVLSCFPSSSLTFDCLRLHSEKGRITAVRTWSSSSDKDPPDARNHGPSSPSNYERRSPAPGAGTDVSLWRETDSAWQPLRLVDQHEPERKGYLFNNRVPAIFKLATCGKLFELARVHPNLHATSQCIEVT